MGNEHRYSIQNFGLGIGLSLVVIFLLNLSFKFEVAIALKIVSGVAQIGVAWAVYKTKSWRGLSIGLLFYTVIAGFLSEVPRLNIVNESIRNLYFHVPMWLAMIIILFVSVWHSVRFLKSGKLADDIKASEGAYVAFLLGILGLFSGMIWANFTWGKPWHGDPKQMATLIGLLMYAAYIILRGSFQDDMQRARISAIYNIFAYPTLIVMLYILPRMTPDSLHPGGNGNPAFGQYDLDANMRLVFYPAIVGWTLLGVWIAWVRIRIKLLEAKKNGIL